MPATRLLTTAEASDDLLVEVRHLLDRAFDGDFSDDDWEHTLGGWHVVVADGDIVVSHAAVVPRVVGVADRPLRTGYVEIMGEVSNVLRRKFEMGALSTGLHGLNARLGWERWRGPTFVRTGSEVIRTEVEDHGVTVLRFGTSTDIDVAAPISCEARGGDDW